MHSFFHKKAYLSKVSLLFFCLISHFQIGHAQESLSLEEAVQIALEDNFNVVFAKRDQQMATNNNTLGNAGILPQVDITGGYNGSVVNTRQEFLDGRSQSVSGAQSTRRTAALEFRWTIFDGFNMFNNLKIFDLTEATEQLRVRQAMEITLADVMVTYYDIYQKEQTLRTFRENMAVSQERLDIARDRYELGAFSKLDVLRAQVALNEDSTSIISQRQLIYDAKTNLNRLLNRSPDTEFTISDTIPPYQVLDYNELKQELKAKNNSILISKKDLEVSQIALKVAQGNRSPRLEFSADYSYLKSQSDAGFLTSNRSFGPNYGLNLTFPLFDGSNRNREVTNARIEISRQEDVIQNTIVEQEATYEVIYNNYLGAIEQYDLGKYNLEVAEENLEIAIEKNKLGGLSAIDFRDIQLDALAAENTLIGLRFAIKALEIDLLRLSGQLLQPSQN